MAAADLTAARLRELLHYDPETGAFTWRVTRGRTAKAGEAAGNMVEGYVKIMVSGRTYAASRLAWIYVTGFWPSGDVDHRDTDRANNRWTNLRDVTHQVNTENIRKAKSSNKLGLLGVSQHHRSKRFRASIRVQGKLKRLGWYDTPEEAHAVYLNAKREQHAGCTI